MQSKKAGGRPGLLDCSKTAKKVWGMMLDKRTSSMLFEIMIMIINYIPLSPVVGRLRWRILERDRCVVQQA
jgi:hypothetical protein